MPSELKSATSRANGTKSHGPITAEGKEISSQNSLTHGFTSKKTVVLKCESEGDFQEMLGFSADTYQPYCPVEKDLVHEMVACRWRMERLRMMETALLDSEMDREPPEAEITDDPGYQMPSPSAAWSMAHAPSRSPLVTNPVSTASTNARTVRSANCSKPEKSNHPSRCR